MWSEQVLADRECREQLKRFAEWHVEYDEMMMQLPPTAGGLARNLQDFEMDMIRRLQLQQ
jgi:hypothetical protein